MAHNELLELITVINSSRWFRRALRGEHCFRIGAVEFLENLDSTANSLQPHGH